MPEKVILLVEDEPADVILVRHALKACDVGNEVVVARDGAEALDFLFGTGDYAGRDVADLPQVVLLDLKLPKVDGLEVLRRIRADEGTKTIPVVILTSSDLENDKEEASRLGANGYVFKGVDLDTFMNVVRQIALQWIVVNNSAQKESAE